MSSFREQVDCAIIGGGPAGLTGAFYLRRFHRNVALIDAADSRASYIPRTHNYPGFPGGVSGKELLGLMKQQLLQVGGLVIADSVEMLDRGDDGFSLNLASGRHMTAQSVILCVGVKDIEPGIRGSARVRNAGLLRQCPVCDAYEYTDRNIALIGNSQHSVNEALFLREFTDSLSFLSLVRPLPDSLRDPLAAAGVTIIEDAPIELAVSEDRQVVVTTQTGATYCFEALYSALGAQPRSALLLQIGAAVDDCGNLIVDEHCQTSVRQAYAAGDIVQGLNQLTVSTGQAATAATAVHNRLPRQYRQQSVELRNAAGTSRDVSPCPMR
jgi:thioredoxin reductase (NADPH)